MGLLAIASLLIVVSPSLRTFVTRDSHVGYAVGQRVDVPDEFYTGSVYTVLLFLRSDCPSCKASAPSLKAITQAVRQDNRGRVKAISFEDRFAIEAFASALGADPVDAIVLAPEAYGRMRLRAVPTILVVDRQGTIVFESTGLVQQPHVDRVWRVTQSVQ